MTDIATVRRARGMTQGELARELGVRQTAVCAWETGVCRPRPKHIKALAELLEIDAIELSASFNVKKEASAA